MIYLVEDDDSIRELVLYTLHTTGFEAEGFRNAAGFWQALEKELPQLVLLDIMLPDEDGLHILKRLRAGAETADLPVMMLTAKSSEYDRVVGLDSGADDYMPKPFGMMELVSRVNALLRRAQAPAVSACDTLVNGPIELVSSAHTVSVGGTPVALTLKEFDLLRALMRSEGRVLSRGRLLEDVWGVTYVGETRTVDVHIQTLRQKLNAASSGADGLIRTVRGVGYTMKSAS